MLYLHQNRWQRWGKSLAVATLALGISANAGAAQGINLVNCKGLWFSTSEDFLSRNKNATIGGPVVSDGDLLTYVMGSGARICARNADLMRVFDIEKYDHGLDALDQVVIDEKFVVAAFSTELDSVHGAGQFTAGDLLFTTGAIIPNAALLFKFELPRSLNLGLDAVTITGSPRGKRELLSKLSSAGPDLLREKPEILIDILQGTETDILFSTEGTPPDVQNPRFLDGDLLSAKTGMIVRSNADLLPGLPAGLPLRGVDYGLDAYTPGYDRIEQQSMELFSIEVNAKDNSISDGDALMVGPGIYLKDKDLIANFEPLDSDMGLDALAARIGRESNNCEIRITTVSDIDVTDINQATGLFDTDRPFGAWVRIQGIVPGDACPRFNSHEFQVQVSVDGGIPQPILHPASQGWERNVSPCVSSNDLYTSDTQGGWFTLTDYWRFGECPDDASLAYWQSTTAPGADEAVFTIVMRPIGGGVEIPSMPVKIRIDNDKPDQMLAALYRSGEMTPFGDQCKIEGDGNDIVIDIKGRVRDEHFSRYALYWAGGDVHTWKSVPVTVTRTYNSRPDLSDEGTEPAASTDIPLGTLNLTAEYAIHTGGDLIIECGYTVLFRAWDRSHRGRFHPALNAFSHIGGNRTDYIQSFCLKP
ncbi:MAG: hypothetical protein V3V13_00440 [Paracoccaceae bacterium]